MNIDDMPTTTELRDALAAAIRLNYDAFPPEFEIDAEAALAAILAGDVEPWVEYEGDNVAESLALACVMNDGPWWSGGEDDVR
jgi:hypothetical protein